MRFRVSGNKINFGRKKPVDRMKTSEQMSPLFMEGMSQEEDAIPYFSFVGNTPEAIKSRTLIFNDVIEEKSSSLLINELLSLAMEDSTKPIKLILGSPGGELYESLAIYDCIRMLPCPVIAICTGKVMSGGIVILLACEQRFSAPNTTFMIHHGSTTIHGSIPELKKEVHEVDLLNEKMLDIILKETKITREELNNWLVGDYFLNAQEALKVGLIQKVIKKFTEVEGMFESGDEGHEQQN